jgi:hypothetical protein
MAHGLTGILGLIMVFVGIRELGLTFRLGTLRHLGRENHPVMWLR